METASLFAILVRKTYNRYMRSYHRKTLIKKEGWPLVDGWYWCPEVVIKDRIAAEKRSLKGFFNHSAISFEFLQWKKKQKELSARLAHACHDGRIRACSGWGVEYFKKVGGISRVYGKCRFCDEPLSDGIKMIILMEKTL